MINLLMGGSPCTYWSIAQKNNRETEPSGLGWELFLNYVIAWRSGQFDYFLYENNKSMAKPIRNQIDIEFNRTYAENTNWELVSTVEDDKGHTKRWLWRNKTTGKTECITRILINSALVSAQNRQRYYWTNIPNVAQPADRGILLKDILESGTDLSQNEKGYTLTASYDGAVAWNTLERSQRTMVAEPIRIPEYGDNTKARPVNALYPSHAGTGEGSLEQRLCSNNPSKQQVDLIAEPIGAAQRTRDTLGGRAKIFEIRPDAKSNALTTVQTDSMVAEPIRIGTIESDSRTDHDSKQYRVYSPEGKSTTICGQGGGVGAKTGLYACPIGETQDGKTYPVYTVANGLITIKDKQYPIKLPDGYYIIRKLTVKECMRLQTVPEWYIMPCSNSQNYKCLGNGWTVEVIKHILSHITDMSTEEVSVVSMYDGMSCGQIALTELGAKIVRYEAYEIDKYCVQSTQHNFPNTIQLGDAFAVRERYQYLEQANGQLRLAI